MPVNWTPEANAKASTATQFVFGIIDQLCGHNLHLSYKSLAKYMGGDCTPKNIDNQIQKLKKQAAAADTGTATATETSPAKPATPTTKRTTAHTETPPSKKRRVKLTDAVRGAPSGPAAHKMALLAGADSKDKEEGPLAAQIQREMGDEEV
ncbi:hypothetical protein BDW74DRAFT_183552 [Aspergillus multicolor]|uniref:uncharacterized protein n=1 Tax=Aspergillus multicolor TaxID=41759 RepID=UPI003CCE1552